MVENAVNSCYVINNSLSICISEKDQCRINKSQEFYCGHLAKYPSKGDIFPLVIGFMSTYIFILWNALHTNKMKKENKI